MFESVLNYVVLLKQRTCVQTDRAMRIPSAKGNTSAIYNAGASISSTRHCCERGGKMENKGFLRPV